MNHIVKIGVRLGLLGLLVSAGGCAYGETDGLVDLEEDVGTTAEAVVNGWTSWSTSSQYFPGGEIGCHSGSLVTAIERQGSSTRILCTPVPNTKNTDSKWLQWTPGGGNAGWSCGYDSWVTGYQSASWPMGSGFRLRCSKTSHVSTGKPLVSNTCAGYFGATNNTGPTWFPPAQYMKAGGCGNTCATLNWTACTSKYQ